MQIKSLSTKGINFLHLLIFILIILYSLFVFPYKAFAAIERGGQEIFIQHCSGCHINGGNIVRRNKTLKLRDLKRNGLDNPEAIALVAKDGIGTMSGYAEKLSNEEENIVASWIWEQAQNAWTQG